MTMPTSEEFEALHDALVTFNTEELRDQARSVRSNFAVVREFLLLVEELRAEKWDQLSRLPAMVWFERQGAFRKAITSVVGRQSKNVTVEHKVQALASQAMKLLQDITLEEYKAGLIHPRFRNEPEEEMRARVESCNRDIAKRHSFESFLEHCTETDTALIEGITVATRNYFYGDRSRVLASQSNQLGELVQRADDAMVTLRDLCRYTSLLSPRDRSRSLAHHLGRLEREIETARQFAAADLTPIQRDDATVKERAFAHELFLRLSQVRRGRNVAAIWHLLSLEGIEHHIDRRQLTRLTKRWQLSLRKVNTY
jgi:hypothetical protein